mmetsp:Transcript_10464/g.21488  ORF Transcript_10464/g.21488 Transcript_10464/m.21488 type:complete len:369 (-) Transcript_10464:214-1320(-)
MKFYWKRMKQPTSTLLALAIGAVQIHHDVVSAEYTIRGNPNVRDDPPPPCDDYLNNLLASLANEDPGEVNRIRRILAMENRPCYKHYFDVFADHFLHRVKSVKKHVNLHIPKAGGMSLCSVARHSEYGSDIPADTNCWERQHFYPMWCLYYLGTRPKWESCEDLDESTPDFVMNENYLDYPLCMQQRLYSTLIREPVERAISHELHLEALKDTGNHEMPKKLFESRLAMGRMNYMTWALSADLFADNLNKASLVPGKMHAEVAMDTLSRFDFIMELSEDVECDAAILHFMGLGDDVVEPHMNAEFGKFEAKWHPPQPRSVYEEWNNLDKEVYDYAKRLIKVDCEFFKRLKNANSKPRYHHLPKNLAGI